MAERRKPRRKLIFINQPNEAICLTRHQQNSLLAAARQGDEGYETATKYSDLVCINTVSHTVDIHVSDP
ncbi:DUF5431 family protein [Klebsiella oxytoca]|uniref:DUF5431 family protein n=1 Tax=Klebsiella oxytoca TaxID=571 RepID=UPI0034D1C8A6